MKPKRVALLVILALLAAALTPSPASATTTTLVAQADAFVLASAPDASRGNSTPLRIRDDVKRSYFRFNLSGLPQGEAIDGATFRVFATSTRKCTQGAELLRSANDTWGESTITWNNQPGPTGQVLATATSWTANSYVSFDVSSAVTGGTSQVSFVLRHASGCSPTGDATFQSREATNKPQLVVATSPSGTPQCSDGVDNDSDGLTDFPLDLGCTDANDNDETDAPPPTPQCSDGVDNDSDGKTDFPNDPGCTDANDNDETDAPPPAAAAVQPVLETPPVDGSEDAADDPAIWVHPTDRSKSLVIGSNKNPTGSGGLHVYNLAGQQLSKAAQGSAINGVDVRDAFPLGAETVPLVAATNKTGNSTDFFRIDGAAGTLTKVGSVSSSTPGIRGSCMYRSQASGKFYAFSTHASGVVHQLELNGSAGAVTGQTVRSFDVGSAIEGCVADDGLGHLYVAEETVGVRKYGAEPNAGTTRTTVDRTGAQGHLVRDVEGMTIWLGPSGTGWLLVSSQGESTFAVYTRQAPNTYKGEFDLTASGAIDDTTETDGIDVTSASLPAPFEGGLFVAHDHSLDGASASNFKFAKWSDIAAALGLT
jgi:3-phytase